MSHTIQKFTKNNKTQVHHHRLHMGIKVGGQHRNSRGEVEGTDGSDPTAPHILQTVQGLQNPGNLTKTVRARGECVLIFSSRRERLLGRDRSTMGSKLWNEAYIQSLQIFPEAQDITPSTSKRAHDSNTPNPPGCPSLLAIPTVRPAKH